MTTEFDRVFDQMEAPEYPATCDNCGYEATNAEIDQHICSDAPAAPERGETTRLKLPARPIRESTITEQVIDGNLIVRQHGDKYLLINESDWPIAEMYNKQEAERLAVEHNQYSTLIAQRDQLAKILSMMICHGCHNRIGWTETPTKYGDWTKCSSCREARAVLTTIEQEGTQG